MEEGATAVLGERWARSVVSRGGLFEAERIAEWFASMMLKFYVKMDA